MAITISNSTAEPRAFAIGPKRFQIVNFTVATGATAGTVTADSLNLIQHVLCLGSGVLKHTAAPTFATNIATLAFTCPTATAATLTKGGVTYTAVATSAAGNAITVAYTAGATAGSEVVTVVGNAISVQIENGVSTITQVRAAVNAAAPAAALVTATGTSATVVATATASALTGGITGGGAGTFLCIGV